MSNQNFTNVSKLSLIAEVASKLEKMVCELEGSYEYYTTTRKMDSDGNFVTDENGDYIYVKNENLGEWEEKQAEALKFIIGELPSILNKLTK